MELSANLGFPGHTKDAQAVVRSQSVQPRLWVDAGHFAERFDREPFALQHNLHRLDLFQPDSLAALAARYVPHPGEYFVAGAAQRPGVEFDSVEHGHWDVKEALRRIDSSAVRLLLKRPENRDTRFRELLRALFEQVMELRGGLGREKLVRLESALFITSASTITPFHYDPETAFFMQVAGRKHFHVYAPSCMTEPELESFYQRGIVSIAEVDLATRDPRHERAYLHSPGDGHHQPQNAPHWVQTDAERSVSYSFVFETDVSRAMGRVRACNYFLRRAGLSPPPPAAHRVRDQVKATAIRAAFPLRRRLRRLASQLDRS